MRSILCAGGCSATTYSTFPIHHDSAWKCPECSIRDAHADNAIREVLPALSAAAVVELRRAIAMGLSRLIFCLQFHVRDREIGATALKIYAAYLRRVQLQEAA